MQFASCIMKPSSLYQVSLLEPFGMLVTATAPIDMTMCFTGKLVQEWVKTFRLVILRGFNAIDKHALVNYAQTIGPLLEWEFGAVMEMRVHEEPTNYLFTNGPAPFHWDGAFHRTPRYLLFHCIEAPLAGGGGETLFCDTGRIWQQANSVQRQSWQELRLTFTTEKKAHYGGSVTVPFVQTHPDLKGKMLRFAEPVPETMLNPVSVEVVGMNEEDAEGWLQDFAAKCYDGKNCYTHAWQQGDFLLADNHALLHARHAFKQFSPRHLRRIQIL